jgi:hypothetical protein
VYAFIGALIAAGLAFILFVGIIIHGKIFTHKTHKTHKTRTVGYIKPTAAQIRNVKCYDIFQ